MGPSGGLRGFQRRRAAGSHGRSRVSLPELRQPRASPFALDTCEYGRGQPKEVCAFLSQRWPVSKLSVNRGRGNRQSRACRLEARKCQVTSKLSADRGADPDMLLLRFFCPKCKDVQLHRTWGQPTQRRCPCGGRFRPCTERLWTKLARKRGSFLYAEAAGWCHFPYRGPDSLLVRGVWHPADGHCTRDQKPRRRT